MLISSDVTRVLENSSVAVSLADLSRPDAPLVFVNSVFSELTGYAPASCLGQNCRFLQGAGTDPRTVGKIGDAVRNVIPIETCLLNYRANGEPFHNYLAIYPVRTPEGSLLALGCQYRIESVATNWIKAHFNELGKITEQVTSDNLSNIQQQLFETISMRSSALHMSVQSALERSRYRKVRTYIERVRG